MRKRLAGGCFGATMAITLAACSHPPAPARFTASAQRVAVTLSQCVGSLTPVIYPPYAMPDQCGDYVAHASWFAMIVRNEGDRPGSVADCSITGFDDPGVAVFRASVHAGSYISGIEIAAKGSKRLLVFSADPPHGLIKAPASVHRFTLACPIVHSFAT